MTSQPLGAVRLSVHYYQSGMCGKFNGGARNNLLKSTTNHKPSTIYTDPATTERALVTYRL